MGLDIQVSGSYPRRGLIPKAPAPEEFLRECQPFFESLNFPYPVNCTLGQDSDGHRSLFVRIHPAGSDLQITVPQKGRFVASARTSTVGPGYHAFICEALDDLAQQLKLQFDKPAADDPEGRAFDDTSYFTTRDETALEREFSLWLGAITKQLPQLAAEGESEFAVNMSLDYGFEWPGAFFTTPMGPRSRQWVEAVAKEPKRGFDIFPWPSIGVDAAFHLGLATTLMWCDVRWAPPLTDADGMTLALVSENLKAAYRLDPTLAYPWREWREILKHLGDAPDQRKLARDLESLGARVNPKTPLIGYRRNNVTMRIFNGWSLKVPGHFVDRYEDQGSSWEAFDQTRHVRFSAFSMDLSAEKILADTPAPDDAEILETLNRRDGHLLRRGYLIRPPDEDFPALLTFNATTGRLAMCTITIPDLTATEWALDVWHSVRYPPPDSSEGG